MLFEKVIEQRSTVRILIVGLAACVPNRARVDSAGRARVGGTFFIGGEKE